MSTVIADTYEFHTLGDWEMFYRTHKDAIHKKDTRWLNHHISIEDDNRKYRIFFRKGRLYLKPFIKVDVKKTAESAQLHQMNLILEKLDELAESLYNLRGSSESHTRELPLSLSHKGVIERIKEINTHKDDTAKESPTVPNTTAK